MDSFNQSFFKIFFEGRFLKIVLFIFYNEKLFYSISYSD